MFNPFAHLDEMVHTNIDAGQALGLPAKSVVTLRDGQVVEAATPGQPDTLTFWLMGANGTFAQITHEMEFVQNLWLHAKYGAPLDDWHSERLDQIGLSHDFTITPDAMREAVYSMPHVLADIQSTGWTENQVWAYTQAEAPWAVALVGIA